MNLLIQLALKVQDLDGSGTTGIRTPYEVPVGGLVRKWNGNISLQTVIQRGITVAIVIAITLSLFFLIWGGVQWIMSAGDKHKIDQARSRIIYALIGLMVIFFSYFIVNLVGNFFGVDVFCQKKVCL